MHLLVRPGGAISSPRPGCRWPPRAVTVKDGRRPSRSDSPLTVTSTAAGYVGRVSFAAVANDDNSEGSSPSGAKIARIQAACGRSNEGDEIIQAC